MSKQTRTLAEKRGNNLRRAREVARMTAKTLAEKAGVCGTEAIYAYEAGRVVLPEKNARIFAGILGVTPEALLRAELDSVIVQEAPPAGKVSVLIAISSESLDIRSTLSLTPPNTLRIMVGEKEIYRAEL